MGTQILDPILYFRRLYNESWSVFRKTVHKGHICPGTGTFGRSLNFKNQQLHAQQMSEAYDLIWTGYFKESDWSWKPDSWSLIVFTWFENIYLLAAESSDLRLITWKSFFSQTTEMGQIGFGTQFLVSVRHFYDLQLFTKFGSEAHNMKIAF